MLQDIRKKRGYSQSELAIKSGVKLRTLQAYESGINNIDKANLNTLCDLALAMNCKITDILSDKELIAKYKLANKVKNDE